jgi:hypothetical protein
VRRGEVVFSTFWFDYVCAVLSCVLGSGYFLMQLRDEKPPPGFIVALRATVLLSLFFFVAVLSQHRG